MMPVECWPNTSTRMTIARCQPCRLSPYGKGRIDCATVSTYYFGIRRNMKESVDTSLSAARPSKELFLMLLAAWIALFHFYGNSTLGYVNTPSLFGWWLWVNTRGLDGATLWEMPGRLLGSDDVHVWVVP